MQHGNSVRIHWWFISSRKTSTFLPAALLLLVTMFLVWLPVTTNPSKESALSYFRLKRYDLEKKDQKDTIYNGVHRFITFIVCYIGSEFILSVCIV